MRRYRYDASSGIAEALTGGPGTETTWGLWPNRKLRYAVLWQLASNNAYGAINRWSKHFKDCYELPDAIRGIHNPASRIGEFWAEHLYPGQVDPEAGDGSQRASSVPILGAREATRAGLRTLWRDSRLTDVLDEWTRHGAIAGDAFLKVTDDPERRKVGLEAVPPWHVKACEVDLAGNVRGYTIERPIQDQSRDNVNSTYREVCVRGAGDSIHFKTLIDDEPANLNGVGSEWTEDYGFVPMAKVQHRNVGAGWGQSEAFASLPRLLEVDAMASMIADHVYKSVNSPWFFEGGKVQDVVLSASSDGPDAYPILGGEGKPHPLVVPLSIADATGLLAELMGAIEAAHPELLTDKIGANASGVARRLAREQVESRVIRRRASYDEALKRACQMALSIAGQHDYEGYDDIWPWSYRDGELDFTIGPRPVFNLSETERVDLEKLRGEAVRVLTDGGLPLGVAMRRAGFDPGAIREAMAERDGEALATVRRARMLGFHDPGLEDAEFTALPNPNP